MDAGTSQARTRLARRLRRWRLAARLVLILECLWPALWPASGVLGALLAAALLGLAEYLPPWLHAATLGVGGLAVGTLLVCGLWGLRWPDRDAADRRLERDSGLAHRPLAVLADRPAGAGSLALWEAHVARALAQIGRLRLAAPHPGMVRRDPQAVRVLVLLVLAAALAVAGDEAPARLARALVPVWSPGAAALPIQLAAWITPPAYTGMAPVFLKPAGGAARVPQGAVLTLSLTGGSGAPGLALDGAALPVATLGAASFHAEVRLDRGGWLVLRQGWHEIGRWDLTVLPDAPPDIAWSEPPGAARGQGPNPATRFPWMARHAYGVTALSAELRLRERPDAPPLVVPIPLPDGPVRDGRGRHLLDLTAHPWAGLPVTARLVGRDGAGLAGQSAQAEFVLPERSFDNPAAQVLVAARRGLSRHPADREAALVPLAALAAMTPLWDADHPGYLVLREAEARLRAPPDSAVEEAQALMWSLALRLEKGTAARTEEDLDAAREDARQALEAGQTPDRAALDRNLGRLEEALRQHLRALAGEARNHPGASPPTAPPRLIDAADLLRLAGRMREEAEQGRMDAARQTLAELEHLLDALVPWPGDAPTNSANPRRAARGNHESGGDTPGDAMDSGEGDGDGRDPLGRRLGQAPTGSGGIRLPDHMERQRASTLLDELRRRAGDRSRPQTELDYLDRLLRPF